MSDVSALAARLERLYVPAVLDALEEVGLRDQALAPGLSPVDPSARLAGPAYPYAFVRSESWVRDAVIPGILRVYETAPAGSVLVAAAGSEPPHAAHFGELSAETCARRGLRGAIVDGGLRDGPRVAQAGFPVWFRYRTPVDVVGRWEVDCAGEAVTIDGVTICPGDWVVADLDGVVVIPAANVVEVAEAAERCSREESAIRDRLGRDPASQLYRETGRF